MNGRKLYWPRGRGWGGSSSINGMIYIRGHAGDYDQWAQMGLKGWDYASVLPYFKRSETLDKGENEYHGGSGPLNISSSPLSSPLYRAFIQAGEQAGYKVTDDFNGAQQEGFGPYQRTIHKGERWSASYAYLRPVVDVRDNLTVISTGRVTRVLFEGTRATGVEVVEGKGGLAQSIFADGEVIVCAGAVQSPQLLMLSGIGNAEHLDRFGIKAVVDSKGVGQNLQDHLDVTVIHEMTQPISAYSAQKGLKKLGVGLRYLFNQTGPGADNFLQAGAFLKSRSGLEMPDIQLHLVNAIMIDHARHNPQKDGYTVHACQLRPESRGTVCLGSNDPFANPLIDPNHLATEEDRRAMRESVKMVRDVCAQAALKPFTGPEMIPGSSAVSDEDIDSFIRRTGETIYHPVGTCAMGVGEHQCADDHDCREGRGPDPEKAAVGAEGPGTGRRLGAGLRSGSRRSRRRASGAVRRGAYRAAPAWRCDGARRGGLSGRLRRQASGRGRAGADCPSVRTVSPAASASVPVRRAGRSWFRRGRESRPASASNWN